MTRNYKEEFETIRRSAIDVVKTVEEPENYILHLSFTEYGKGIYEKKNKKLLDDAELDYSLGVLSEKQYNQLKMVYAVIEKSIVNGNLY